MSYPVKKWEEIKENEHVIFSEAFVIRFWKRTENIGNK
jgi:hypothetical protein